MRQNFSASLQHVLKHEGGFVNHPKDPGGATNKGVTLATFQRYVKSGGTINDLKNITNAQLEKVYREQYWNAVRGDDMPSGVDYAVFDYAVNSGPSRAIKHLQDVLGQSQDGIIGPATMRAVLAADPAVLLNRLCDRRMAFLRGLNTWGTFGKGWTARVDGVRKQALSMAKKPEPFISPEILMPDRSVSIWARMVMFLLNIFIPKRKR